MYAWSLVENLGASATILGLRDEYHFEEKGIFLLDISLFKKPYKDVCSFKETTVYELTKKESIKCDYVGVNISFAKATIYHEAGHLFDNLNPIFTAKMKPSNSKFYPFNRHSWLRHGYKRDNDFNEFVEQEDFIKKNALDAIRNIQNEIRKLNIKPRAKAY